jgi:hypothetical protein
MPNNPPAMDRLKTEILDALHASGLPLFYALGMPGEEGFVYWDNIQFPDWKQFIDVARQSGATMFLFSSHQLLAEELQAARDMIEDVEMKGLDRDGAFEMLDAMRVSLGHEAWIRLAWQQENRRFAFEVVAPWYSQFLDLLDELNDYLPDLDDEEDKDEPEPGGRGGFYSLN